MESENVNMGMTFVLNYPIRQANSANFSWKPPTQPNGNIDWYKVNIPPNDIS